MNLIALALGFAVTATAAHGLAGDGSNEALPARLGEYYEATVPDTVDLAERAGYGVNHFTSVISATSKKRGISGTSWSSP